MQNYIVQSRSSQLPSFAFLCYLIQMMICLSMIVEIDYSKGSNIATYPPSPKMIMVRFCCCLAMHIVMQNELENGLSLMKFAINHSWRFGDNSTQAFFAGFMQTTAALAIEVSNCLIINERHATERIVAGMMRVAVLAQFDNYFYAAIKFSKFKQLLIDVKTQGKNSPYSNLLKITKTSSNEMPRSNDPNSRLTLEFDPTLPKFVNENNQPDPRFTYKKLKYSGKEMLMRIVYKAFRGLQIVFWFYFFPFVSIILSFLIPWAQKADTKGKMFIALTDLN